MSLDMLFITRAEFADASWPLLCDQYAAFLSSLPREKPAR